MVISCVSVTDFVTGSAFSTYSGAGRSKCWAGLGRPRGYSAWTCGSCGPWCPTSFWPGDEVASGWPTLRLSWGRAEGSTGDGRSDCTCGGKRRVGNSGSSGRGRRKGKEGGGEIEEEGRSAMVNRGNSESRGGGGEEGGRKEEEGEQEEERKRGREVCNGKTTLPV